METLIQARLHSGKTFGFLLIYGQQGNGLVHSELSVFAEDSFVTPRPFSTNQHGSGSLPLRGEEGILPCKFDRDSQDFLPADTA